MNQNGAVEFCRPLLTRMLLICALDGFRLPEDRPRMVFDFR